MTNKKAFALGIASCFAFFIFIGILVTPEKKSEPVVQEKQVEQTTLETVFYDEFMKSCTKDTVVSKTTCACMYKYVVDKVGFEEMYRMATTLQEGDMPEIYMKAAVACIQ